MTTSSHRDLIVDQFTRQATPFSTAKTIANEEALQRLLEACGAGPEDTVLDVACGGGLVVCAFAQVVRRAEGIDITPAMLDRARALAAEKGLTNTHWRHGDVLPLPYPDASFTIVSSRFTFHHFQDPLGVLREMKRVCAPDRDTQADVLRAAGRAGESAEALVPESGRRRQDPGPVPRLGRGRPPGYPDPARGRASPLRLSGRDPGHRPSRRMTVAWEV
jgi:ubiquinone/menaquinone biosynthesis C-methylase UbiE